MAIATQNLELFVRDALTRGASRDEIEAALADAGWPPEQVRSALDVYADIRSAVPVPRPRPYLSAREAFLYVLLLATLYLTAWQLGSLLFDLIDRALPDPADPAFMVNHLGHSMRWSVATLLIAFPVFVFVARRLARELAGSPAALDAVTGRPGVKYTVSDPVDGAPYLYEVTGRADLPPVRALRHRHRKAACTHPPDRRVPLGACRRTPVLPRRG